MALGDQSYADSAIRLVKNMLRILIAATLGKVSIKSLRTILFSTLFAVMTTMMPSTVLAQSGDADVLQVEAIESTDGSWRFNVTVEHADTGWQDYADGWDVMDEQGNVLKRKNSDPFTRLLLHPHENEQPFTRSVSGIKVPENTRYLTVRAHELKDGFGGKEVVVDLKEKSGVGYTVRRR
ncbi:MAG: hypothetical protein AAF402_02435 [Pseudomonadota bacterium]